MFSTILVISLSSLFFFLWRWFTFWSRQGLNGPKFFELRGFFMEHHEFTLENVRKYGRLYGEYGVTTRHLIVNEPDLIKEIFIKNFNAFPHHKMFHLSQSDKVNKMLFFMPGDEDWKRVRSILSPAFTSGKLKAMMSHISDVSDDFVANLEEFEKKGEVVDMREFIGSFAMDVISACAYGIKVNSINNPGHPIVVNAKKFFGINAGLKEIISVFAPTIARLLRIEFFDTSAVQYFDELTNQIVNERKKLNKYSNEGKGKKRTDFIQLMLDSEKSVKDLGYDSNSDVETDQNQNEISKKTLGTLTPDEMTAQGIIFFIAGYDTTSAALSHLVYYLSENKDCQQILYEELKDVKEFSYENLSRLKYLNAVIDETLRLAPSIVRIQRQAEHDFELKGIKLPKGSTVEIFPYALHRDPEFWPDPLEFKPERFLNPTHHSWAYLPFGGGPRICIGQRFALNEMRMCAAKLFSKFEFTLAPGFKMEYFNGNILMSPKSVLVNLKSRDCFTHL